MNEYVVFYGKTGDALITAATMADALAIAIETYGEQFDHLTRIYPCIGDTYQSIVRSFNEKCR